MEELSESVAEIIEFPASSNETATTEHLEISTSTNPLPKLLEKNVETNRGVNAEMQTESSFSGTAHYDEEKLANWLKRICPFVENELRKGPTPLSDNYGFALDDDYEKELTIQTYQKISLPSNENYQGLATWLSIFTNNTPVLVLATAAVHDSWCEHVDQSVKVLIPKRMQSSSFLVFQELKSIPTKACLGNLSTNPFEKNIFAGSTVSDDLYIWKFTSHKRQADVEELICETLEYGNVIDFDWPSADRIITCHANGQVCIWIIGKYLVKENAILLRNKHKAALELSTIASISLTDFVVGCSNGDLYHCRSNNVGSVRGIELTEMKGHKFAVSSLLKKNISDKQLIISCDLSGEVFFHDLINLDEDGPKIILKIPLPFQNNITCTKDGNVLFCPGLNGALEIYRINSGKQTKIKGVLQGRGNVIKLSDNGLWIVTGLYGNDFQIFKLWD